MSVPEKTSQRLLELCETVVAPFLGLTTPGQGNHLNDFLLDQGLENVCELVFVQRVVKGLLESATGEYIEVLVAKSSQCMIFLDATISFFSPSELHYYAARSHNFESPGSVHASGIVSISSAV